MFSSNKAHLIRVLPTSTAMFFKEANYLVSNLMNAYQAIGIMSGSSLDGLDICAATFQKGTKWGFQMDAFVAVPFPDDLYHQLLNCRSLSGESLHRLDIQLGLWLGGQVVDFMNENRLNPVVIGSHGHTVFHQVDHHLSLQIGNGHAIAEKTGVPVVADFRQQNVLLGGHGAPLVPIGDILLFEEYDAWINIGGIANATIRTKKGFEAGDIVPANQVLNALANKLGFPFDEGGQFAQQGKLNRNWHNYLGSIDFFEKPFPKSISNEWVKKELLDSLPETNPEDALFTYTSFMASQIAGILPEETKRALVTGGGALNTFLIDQLKAERSEVDFEVPEEDLIQSKEALVFAFMGLLRHQGEVNCLASYTGSNKDISAGVVYMP